MVHYMKASDHTSREAKLHPKGCLRKNIIKKEGRFFEEDQRGHQLYRKGEPLNHRILTLGDPSLARSASAFFLTFETFIK